MNEEEILKNINEMITLIDDECYISIPEDIESIKGLFYLYNKYKKENKKLQKVNKELKTDLEFYREIAMKGGQ